MAYSVKIVNKTAMGYGFLVYAELTLDNSYATGGYAVKPQDFKLSQISWLTPVNESGYLGTYNRTTKMLKVLNQVELHTAPGADTYVAFPEVPSTTDLSAVTIGVLLHGH